MSRNETLMFLNVAHFFDHLFLLIFPTAAIAIAAEWGLTYGEALALGTPVYVMFALGTLPAGWLGDRFDRTLLIALFFVACGASSLLISLSTGPKSLMLGLGFLGLSVAAVSYEAQRLIVAITVLSLVFGPLWLESARRLHRIVLLGVTSARETLRLAYGREAAAIMRSTLRAEHSIAGMASGATRWVGGIMPRRRQTPSDRLPDAGPDSGGKSRPRD